MIAIAQNTASAKATPAAIQTTGLSCFGIGLEPYSIADRILTTSTINSRA